MRSSATKGRQITLRDLIDFVYRQTESMPPAVAEAASRAANAAMPLYPVAIIPAGSMHVVLRSTKNLPQVQTQTPTPTRKYLWVRRTSRRAYNVHMSKMHETFGEIKAMPALALFSSLITIAVVLSLLIR